ncbi:ABC transporter [Corynebacterium phocae]|uniref:ABC transporter n=1 Tax=Corynebacterium phocae TaxID=161895 RepID=A0A1L7D509_9CORY|nr:GTPase [Corynebacterium phocae]APT93234.1 ABC transporter [Corynebacterium phocae]KAA8721551.1 ABC transporter [Corynebacterium phocae]
MSKLNQRLEALDRAAQSQYLSDTDRATIAKVQSQATARRALSAEHTVVGFLGATGSGKTSLFNAVVGEDLGASSPRRPTTSSPLAAVWHPEGSAELLDWLGVEDRRNRPGDFAPQAGPLILLDLPDFDSVEASNREIATRLAGQVDVLVWVTDPEKYADKIIHQDFIAPHAAHSAVTLAVLNKADKLKAADIPVVTESLAGLLREDGLKKVSVIATSAVRGEGIAELKRAIAKVAAKNNALNSRIAADLDALAAKFAAGKAGWPGQELARVGGAGSLDRAKKDLDTHLAQAAGAQRLAAATAAAYRKRLGQTTGWLLTSWMLRFRPDPLRRFGLKETRDTAGVHRSSLPELDASGKAVSNQAVRAYATHAAAGLPAPWANAIAERAEAIAAHLPEELDRAAARTKLPAQPSKAWGIMTFVQWLALLTALVGVLWYLAVAFIPGALHPLLGDNLVPKIEGWPYPTLLILGGLLLGVVLGLVTAAFGGVIGASIRARTRRALRREIAAISAAEVTQPLGAIRQDYLDFSQSIRSAG